MTGYKKWTIWTIPECFRGNLEETASFGRWYCCCIVDGGGGIVEVMEMASALCFG